MRDLVPGKMAEAHAGHAAALQDLAGTMRTFLCDAALPAVQALSRARALTLLPAIHWIVNTVHPGLVYPEAALYKLWMDWHTSNGAGLPV